MIYYHGTTLNAARSILRDGYIRTANKDTVRYNNAGRLNTTLGKVYISTLLNVAVGYAIEESNGNYKGGPQTYVIFKIDIPESEVLEDEDNKLNPAIVSELYQNGEGCFEVGRDLKISQDVIAYICFNIKSYQAGCSLADSQNLTDKFSDRWHTL